MERKRVFLISAIAILVIILIVYFLVSSSFSVAFKKIFGFAPPDSAQVEGYKYHHECGGFCVKMKVDEEEMQMMLEDMERYWGSLYYFEGIVTESERKLMSIFIDPDYSWWDFDMDDTWIYGERYTEGKKTLFGISAKTRITQVFVTSPVDGQWSVYINIL